MNHRLQAAIASSSLPCACNVSASVLNPGAWDGAIEVAWRIAISASSKLAPAKLYRAESCQCSRVLRPQPERRLRLHPMLRRASRYPEGQVPESDKPPAIADGFQAPDRSPRSRRERHVPETGLAPALHGTRRNFGPIHSRPANRSRTSRARARRVDARDRRREAAHREAPGSSVRVAVFACSDHPFERSFESSGLFARVPDRRIQRRHANPGAKRSRPFTVSRNPANEIGVFVFVARNRIDDTETLQ